MITLAIDAGNTRLKWGTHDGRAWLVRGALEHETMHQVSRCLEFTPEVDRMVISNVAGDDIAQELGELSRTLDIPILWARSMSQQCGLRNGYENPAQLGVDRWCAMIGARAHAKGPLLVVNVGTAMTVDSVTGDGLFMGGLILPGMGLMMKALAQHTAKLRHEFGVFRAFPKNTRDAMTTGVIQACVGAITLEYESLKRACGGTPMCVISGGAAPILLRHLELPAQHEDALVLDGLIEIARDASAAD